MESIVGKAHPFAKRLFSLGIPAYVVLCLAVAIFAHRIFGAALAIGVSLMLSLPLLVSLRMLGYWQTQKQRDFLLLVVLLFVDFGGVGYVIRHNYDLGMDKLHVEELKVRDLVQALREDPAYRRVEAELGRKQTLFVDGKVDSRADLARLTSLVEQYGVPALVRVEVNNR
jgi:hypothetical protein